MPKAANPRAPKKSPKNSPKKPPKKPQSAEEQLAAAFDQLLEVVMAEAESPREVAAGLAALGWDAGYPAVSRQFALQALRVDPDCSEALLLLADLEPPGSQAALDGLQEALKAAERTLGPVAFEQHRGEFWAVTETRPYMTARLALANCLYDRGDRPGARLHYEGMLALNPNDNQGIRYILATLLLEEGDDEAAATLFATYDEDDSPFLSYARALLAFRRGGSGPESDAALEAALDGNRHVAAYLLGRRRLPARMPDYYSPGERDEAQLYVLDNLDLWRATPGALDWLKRRVPKA